MQFLLWDAQRRAGITDEQITQAMIEKLAVNKQRKWPAPKDGEPRLHIKEQPAPVVPEEKTSAIEGLKQSLVDCNRYNYCFDAVTRVENACRAAMCLHMSQRQWFAALALSGASWQFSGNSGFGTRRT